MLTGKFVVSGYFAATLGLLAGPAMAGGGGGGGNGSCNSLPGWSALKNALTSSITPANGGLGDNMWGVIVDPSGIVCAVAFSGASYTSAMARQPGDRGAEGEHRERVQPGSQ